MNVRRGEKKAWQRCGKKTKMGTGKIGRKRQIRKGSGGGGVALGEEKEEGKRRSSFNQGGGGGAGNVNLISIDH